MTVTCAWHLETRHPFMTEGFHPGGSAARTSEQGEQVKQELRAPPCLWAHHEQEQTSSLARPPTLGFVMWL